MRRCLYAILLLLLVYGTSTGQVSEQDTVLIYTDIFGGKYTEAERYLALQHWIADSLSAHDISPAFGKAIVFPEVIRYSSIRDKLELQGLFTLYVQYGTKYSNFSVGRFQMKPSFAQQVERDMKRLEGNPAKTLGPIDTTDTPEARLSRVMRLESPEWQLQYLIWFIKIMDQRYGEIYKEETLDKLKFYATAYNCGYASATQVIRQNMVKNTFHTAIFCSDVYYNYGDIACAYYSSR